MAINAKKHEQQLLAAIASQRVSHAFFISCADPSASLALAEHICATLCPGSKNGADDPNLIQIDGAATNVAAVRAIRLELAMSPFLEGKRAVVITDAHRLSHESQNALLKTLEEPPAHTVFLLTGSVDGVLPTIASRCSILRMGLPAPEDIEARLIALGASRGEAKLYARASGCSFARAERLLSDEQYRAVRTKAQDAMEALLDGGLPLHMTRELAASEGAYEAMSFMLSYMRDLLLLSAGAEVQENPDRGKELEGFSKRFTIGQTACIIEILIQASADLATARVPKLTGASLLGRLFIAISEETSKQ